MSTKKLAKKLGLVRKRSQSSTGQKKPLVSNQIFSYLIVIDFESTCWREKNNYGQEIIEFPAVLLNTSTGEVESEFHTYVQPQEHPVLSEFCTELTGITQRQVEAGIPLQICLSRFSRWLQTLQLQNGVVFPRDQRASAASASQKPCAFLTWSDWDLGVCLQYECKRKQLHKPDVLNSWIDLRATYRLFYNRKPKGLNGALQDLGIKFSGREHSGLDDARNTAQLAVRMMRDGCVMKITRSQERAPLKDKPFFGNAVGKTSKPKEKDKNTEEEKVQTTNKTPPPETPRQQKSPSHESHRSSNPKQEPVQGHQSLVSPRTLLNGLTTPLWGSSSRFVKVTDARLSSPVVTNAPVPHNDGNGVVLFSTTVNCHSHLPQPDVTSEPEAAGGLWEEEEGAAILVETEERCGSYDDVVLEVEDDVGSDLCTENKMFDIEEDTSCSDRGCSLQKESAISHSVKGRANVTANHSVTKTPYVEKALKPDISRSSNTSVSLTERRSQSKTCVTLDETRSAGVSLPGPSFAVPKAVTSSSKSPSSSSGRDTVAPGKPFPAQCQGESRMPHNPSISLNTSSVIRTPAGVPSKTSPPDGFAKPKPIGAEQNPFGRYSRSHKETVKDYFTIYTDPAKPSTTTSHPPSRSSLGSSSFISRPSILSSSSTNRSSLLSASRGKVSKITSPLCACGRRAKRLTVANGGPNHGRGFYCCPVRRSGGGNRIQKGCEFFKWESALIKANYPAIPAARSSVSLCFNSSLHHRPLQTSSSSSTSSRKSY